jgi:hypothetical protein
MFRLEVEALVLVIAFVVGFLFYRGLIRSQWFSRLVGGTKPLPENSEEVLDQLDEAESLARKRAEEAIAEDEAYRKFLAERRAALQVGDKIRVAVNGHQYETRIKGFDTTCCLPFVKFTIDWDEGPIEYDWSVSLVEKVTSIEPTIQVGKEYEYLDQFVKVLEVYGPPEYREAVIEMPFGARTTVAVSELLPKRKR